MHERKNSAQGRWTAGIKAALTALLLSTLIAAPAAAAPPLPPDFTAYFTLSRAGLNVASSTVELRRSGDEAVYSSIARPAGIVSVFRNDVITERSRMAVAGGELELREYLYRHEGGRKPREAIFAVEGGVARGTWRGRKTELTIPPGTMDRFSVQLLLMRDLARGGERFEYPAITSGKVKSLHFAVTGRENLDLPIGRVETIRVERVKDDDDDYLTIWFAPSFHHLPVRIEHSEDGDRMTLRITGLEWGEETSSVR